MDFQRLLLVALHRLAPIYVATALWWLTDYFAIMIGGVALSIILTVSWPFLQPLLAVIYEEVLHQRSQFQARHRTQWLKRVLPFLNAYKTVVATYPPALLETSGPALTAQLAILAEALRQTSRRRQPLADDLLATQESDNYALVHNTAFSARDISHWDRQTCETWASNLCTALASGSSPALRKAVQHFVAHHAQRTWKLCLADAAQTLDHEIDLTLRQWPCLHKAQDNPEIRQQLVTLLRLDPINRQANLKPYLTAKPLACTPAAVNEIMAHIRYDPVVARVLTLLEESTKTETTVPLSAAP